MFGMSFVSATKIKGIETEEFVGGRRFSQERDMGFTLGKLFIVAFSLLWVGLGVAMPFLPEATVPGMGFLSKAAIGVSLVLFGGFIAIAIWRNLGNVLEVDIANRRIRYFAIDRNNKRHGFREIAFQDIRGVFTEGEPIDDNPCNVRERLIINYKGRPGRLDALLSSSDQIAIVRDFILTEALHQQAAPIVNGLEKFAKRAKWLQQRAN